MDAKDLFTDQGCNGQGVEYVDKEAPGLDTESSFTFVIKSVYYSTVYPKIESMSALFVFFLLGYTSSDILIFMIPTEQEECFRVLDLVTKQ